MNVIYLYKTEFKQQIHDLINCWEYNINTKLCDDIFDLTNTILIVTDKLDLIIKKLETVIRTYKNITFTKTQYGDKYVFAVVRYFDQYDTNIKLKFTVMSDKCFNKIKTNYKYSCILVYMNKDKFKKWFRKEKVNKLLNKELNNMFRDYYVILLC